MISVTVDIVVFTKDLDHLLLIQRKNEPFQDHWALPGGFVDESDKSLKEAATRELEEETGLHVDRLWQIGAWGSADRDPRGWTTTVAFFGLVDELLPVTGADDAKLAVWTRTDQAPYTEMAFDHQNIIDRAKLIAIGWDH